MKPGASTMALACLLGALAPASALAQSSGRGRAATRELIPLTNIDVTAQVSGSLADVTVEQTFENRSRERIEAVYIFPLPNDAAIAEMVMVIGERRIRADLRERQRAREAYEEARRRGHSAALLEQERPNVFTISVSNIAPRQPIRVLVRYHEELPFRDGRYRFHFPTVVGPRFIPGEPEGHEGTGMVSDTAAVPDASRITPAVLPEGTPTPYDVTLRLDVDGGVPIRDAASESHSLRIRRSSPSALTASLPRGERRPDHDILFSYALGPSGGTGAAPGLLTHHDDEREGFFTLAVEPPSTVAPADVRPKEMIFVLDTSGSMHGTPMDISRAAIIHALRHMNPRDTFQVVRFSEAASSLAPRPLENTPANVARGVAFVSSLGGSGGTRMTAGIRAALSAPADGERIRIVLFLTDGYIGNESEVFSVVRAHLGGARLFSLGVGSSVNRYLLDGLAEEGRGAVQYVTVGQSPETVVDGFYERIRNPMLTDITVDWGELDVHSVLPRRIPDVFSGAPIRLAGRYSRGGGGRIVIRGRQGSRQVSIPLAVDLSRTGPDREAIPALWARRRIGSAEREHLADEEGARATILPVALRFGLLTRFTGFVAVEERVAADIRDPLRTRGVPVACPAGVSDDRLGHQVLPPPVATVGYGGGGGMGSGYGRGSGGLRGRRSSVPSIRTGSATVTGSLARDVVQRYIRRHLNQIRFCYEQELRTRPDLAGRVSVRLVILPDGSVRSATVASSTLGDPDVEACVARALRRIAFPALEGSGVLIVTYPFMFQPSAD